MGGRCSVYSLHKPVQSIPWSTRQTRGRRSGISEVCCRETAKHIFSRSEIVVFIRSCSKRYHKCTVPSRCGKSCSRNKVTDVPRGNEKRPCFLQAITGMVPPISLPLTIRSGVPINVSSGRARVTQPRFVSSDSTLIHPHVTKERTPKGGNIVSQYRYLSSGLKTIFSRGLTSSRRDAIGYRCT